jgi:hypothetical protein
MNILILVGFRPSAFAFGLSAFGFAVLELGATAYGLEA